MPNTSDSPTETRNSSAASPTALSSCSSKLREVLRAALRRHALARIRGDDLGDEVRVLGILHGLDDESGLHGLMVALAHEERALAPLVRGVLPGFDDLLDVVGAGLLDDLREPFDALVGLAVEHVGIEPVHVVKALHEVLVARRVDGERIARASYGARHGVADRPHVLELQDLHDRLDLAREAELIRLLEKDRGVLSGQRQVAALRARLLDLGDVAR